MDDQYIHTYSREEQDRLWRQAAYLSPLILDPLDFRHCHHLLDFGCGIGAQMYRVARQYDKLRVTGVDRNADQIAEAEKRLAEYGDRIKLIHADSLSNIDVSQIDTVMLTWVLEHVTDPLKLLRHLREELPAGTRLICTEVFNTSLYLSPDNESFRKYIAAFNQLQTEFGCDVDIGVRLPNLLLAAGYSQIVTRPIHPRIDNTMSPEAREQAICYWRDLYLSARQALEERKMVSAADSQGMIDAFEALRTNPDGVYSYFALQCESIT